MVSLIAVGDIMLSRGVAGRIRRNNDPNYPFLKVKDYLKTGDIVFGNLECPVTDGRKIVSKEMVFRADPRPRTPLNKRALRSFPSPITTLPTSVKKGSRILFPTLRKKT